MPVHIDHMSATVELTEPRQDPGGTGGARPGGPASTTLDAQAVRRMHDGALQSLANRFELYLRSRGLFR